MIDRREILEAASDFSLLPNVVEKDYVLGWILAGIHAHEELQESWAFKGGTCLTSLRQSAESDLVLHAIRANSGEHRSYRVDRIQGASVSTEAFRPRYAVELTSTGPPDVEPVVL